MKLIIKILFIIIVLGILLVTAAYLFLIFKGKAIITQGLADLTQKKVSMSYFVLKPPIDFEIRNLEISGLLKVDSIYLSPNILGFLTGNIALNEVRLTRPEFSYIYEKAPQTKAAFPGGIISYGDIPENTSTVNPGKSTAKASVQISRKDPLPLVIRHINIKDGILHFTDRTTGEEGLKITLKDIYFDLDNLYLVPRSVITNFEFKGRIPWQQDAEEGRIEAGGWLNLFKKDMQATLKIENIDGIYLYPYYKNWVDLEKARIQKAKLNFSSNIQGLNNNVTAQCHLELTDIVFKPREGEEEMDRAEKIAIAVLDIFKALNQGKIELDFTIKTKMDKPQFGFTDIQGAFEDKLAKAGKGEGLRIQGVVMLPAKILEGAVKGATDLSKAVIDGTFAVGNEIKKAIEDTFKKEKKEE